MGAFDLKGIGNLVASGLGIAATAFVVSIQSGATPQQAGTSAATAVILATINHLRKVPSVFK